MPPARADVPCRVAEEAERVFDLYNNAYGNHASDPYRNVRIETYGQDFGQTSWVTTEESLKIPQLLDMGPDSSVLEIGCGSGGYALYLAETLGCQIVGVDINEPGIRSAKELAQTRTLGSRARFEQCDVSKKLPFADATFDAAFSNDVLCHIPARLDLLIEIFRVLKPSGLVLFSDALVIGGMISAEEIAIRSSIGFYFYSPPGENERLLEQAGFSRGDCHRHNRECRSNLEEMARRTREKKGGPGRGRRLSQLRGTPAVSVLRTHLEQRTAPVEIFVCSP